MSDAGIWPPAEHHLLAALDGILTEARHLGRLDDLVTSAVARLEHDSAATMTWKPIPLDRYVTIPPPPVASSWVFVLRAGSKSGAERHPNSWQRMASYQGGGEVQTRDTLVEPWVSAILGSDPHAPLGRRWASIPVNRWHQVVVPPSEHWVVVSFHTATVEALIEERPAGDAAAPARRRYLDASELP